MIKFKRQCPICLRFIERKSAQQKDRRVPYGNVFITVCAEHNVLDVEQFVKKVYKESKINV